MRRVLLWVAALYFLCLFFAFLVWGRFVHFMTSPAGPPETNRTVVVADGTRIEQLVETLRGHGLTKESPWLRIYTDHFRKASRLQPGEYALSAGMSPVRLLAMVERGEVLKYAVSVEPGMSSWQIVELLAQKQLGDRRVLERLLVDPGFAKSLGLSAERLEGYLFPDTYSFARGLDEKELFKAMVARYKQATDLLIRRAEGKCTPSEHQMLTVASLIEKSLVPRGQWRVYAALLYNRLDAEVPLEHPLSFDYGKQGPQRWGAKHPGRSNRWDTRGRTGLPPTPIANPGLGAVLAATRPAVSQAMHMVPKADGGYAFCEDRDCYVAAMKRWHQSRAKKRVRPLLRSKPALGPEDTP